MTMLCERVIVTAKEFLETNNINYCRQFTEPMYQAKLIHFGWDLQFSASSVFAEIVWQIALGETISDRQRLDRLFCPSPIATHANFRGCRGHYKTGNVPEIGAIAIWMKGNSWQGSMAIVTDVGERKETFDVIEGRVLTGSSERFIQVKEYKGKSTTKPFSRESMNLKGFIYPPNREIA